MIENTNLAHRIKGYIECPHGCGEKDFVYEGSSGFVSHKCSRCGRYAMYDLDNMSAEKSKPQRGALKLLKDNTVTTEH
jgi:hypothetical protein